MTKQALTRSDLREIHDFREVADYYRDFPFRAYWQTRQNLTAEGAVQSPADPCLKLLDLLSPEIASNLEPLAGKAAALTRQYFGKQIQLYAPLYLSNHCESGCLYCGFSEKNCIVRNKLDTEQIRREGESLAAMGFRHLLLLTGCSRKETPPEYIQQAVGTLRDLFPSMGIEIYSMSKEEYLRTAEAGADDLTLYQETYDRKLYEKLHPYGPKSDYEERLASPLYAAEAGFRSLNFGVLLGLKDWREDFYLACLHALYLQDRFPSVEVGMSFPRIRKQTGGFRAAQPVSDRELLQAMLSWRIFMPHGGLALSTREPADFRDPVLTLGVTKMSAASLTTVGGYQEKADSQGQFNVSDNRSLKDVTQAIRKSGLQPVYKNWQHGAV